MPEFSIGDPHTDNYRDWVLDSTQPGSLLISPWPAISEWPGLLLEDEFVEEVVFDRGEHIYAHSYLVITLYIYNHIKVGDKLQDKKWQISMQFILSYNDIGSIKGRIN